MTPIEYIKYEFWPRVRPRLVYWWWIIKYRGKKNIPREVVFGALAETVKRMNEDMMQALGAMPDDVSEDDRREFVEAMQKTAEFEREVKELK